MLKRLFGLHFEVATDNASVMYRIGFFKVLIKASKRISIDSTGKSASKLVTLQSLNVIRPKQAKFYRHLFGGGTMQTSVQFIDFEELYIS